MTRRPIHPGPTTTPRGPRWLLLLSSALGTLLSHTGFSASDAGLEFFESRIRPILAEHCESCHSARAEKLKGGLRLDTREGVLAGGDNGPALIPGDPGRSLLVEAIRYLRHDLQMPPKERLKDREIDDLVAWVKMGAPDPRTSSANPSARGSSRPPGSGRITEHWSFTPPRAHPVPALKQHRQPPHPVDAFILHSLEARGLEPTGAADRRTLIRRASFDLLGLPPSPSEIDAFVGDPAPDAWERLVDRLLESPRYGERWGRYWLDVVRYADSKDVRDIGAPYDIVESYRYRDWVIRAFNADLPFDRFAALQIAGDLFQPSDPDAVDPDGIIATGLLTIGCWGPGDADREKMHTDMVDDQINVVTRAFLGLTVSCARCHDHKFDPITMADYYGLAGMFFSTTIAIPQISAPYMKVPLVPKRMVDTYDDHQRRIREMDARLKQTADTEYAALRTNGIPLTAQYLAAALEFRASASNVPRPSIAAIAQQHQLRDDALGQWLGYLGWDPGDARLLPKGVRDIGGNAGVFAYKGDAGEPAILINTNDRDLAIPGRIPARSVAVHPGPKSGVAVTWASPISGRIHIRGRIGDAHGGCGDGAAWRLELRTEREVVELASGDFADGGEPMPLRIRPTPELTVRTGDSLRLAVYPKTSHACDTTSVDLELKELGGDRRWNLAADLVSDPLAGGTGNPHADSLGNPGVWRFEDLDPAQGGRIADRGTNSPWAPWFEAALRQDAVSAAQLASQLQAQLIPATLLAFSSNAVATNALARLASELAAEDGPFRVASRDDARYLTPAAAATLGSLRDNLAVLRSTAPPMYPVAMGAVDGGVKGTRYEGFHDAPIHLRGRYDRLGEVIPRRLPALFAGDTQPGIVRGSGRRELAAWIGSRTNPLTARVIVNRVWQNHFGEGLVRTPGNFGTQGESPTHPELLDWLAVRFMDSGWSIKALHRLVMNTAAYQRSSTATAPSSPGQPDPATIDPANRLLWRQNLRRLDAEAIRDTLLAVSGTLDTRVGGPPERRPGADASSPRRAVYLMINRSDKTGFRFVFDASDPENIVDQRTVSTVAPQMLLLLNNPFALEQVGRVAQRTLDTPDTTDRDRITMLYRTLYGRSPRPSELDAGLGFLGGPQAAATDPDDSRRLRWEQYCQVLLCANELIYVD